MQVAYSKTKKGMMHLVRECGPFKCRLISSQSLRVHLEPRLEPTYTSNTTNISSFLQLHKSKNSLAHQLGHQITSFTVHLFKQENDLAVLKRKLLY